MQEPMKSSIIAQIAAAAASGENSMKGLSLPKGLEFVTNGRGQRLHVRTRLAASDPSNGRPRGLVLYLHGMHSHGSRINFTTLAREINSMGFHYAALDFHGHGYSDGHPGVITSHLDLLDDVESFLSVLYRDPNVERANAPQFHVDAAALDPQSCVFYLLGSSMGGGVALVLAHMCCSRASPANADRYSTACRGCILAAPALQVKLPWFAPSFIVPPLKFIMNWAVLPLVPSLGLPESTITTSSAATHAIWDTDEYISYVNADAASFRGALYFKTLFAIFGLSDAALAAIPQLTHDSMRILVLMDPDDAVTDFAGVQNLQQAAPIAARGRVSVVQMPRGRHDILTNRIDDAVEAIAAWLV